MGSGASLKLRIYVVMMCIRLLVLVLIPIGLVFLAPRMAPVKRGTAEKLWEQACDIPQQFLGHGDVYRPREGWFVYDIQHWHGSFLYRVPEAEVLSSFDQVVEKLRANKNNPDIYPHVRAVFEKWSNCSDLSRQNAEGLLGDIREAYLDHLKTDEPDLYSFAKSEELLVDQRWVQSKWYWTNVVFEWVFLSGLVLFGTWPMRRDRGWRSWALHLGLLPILFMLPVYLGYATFSFTSAGPSGGVLYPWLLSGFFGGRCNELDRQILAHLPRILEPLSAPIGMPLSLSGMGMPGPTTMVIAGLLIALLVFSVHKLRDRLQQTAATARKRIGPSPLPEDQ